MQTEFIDYGWRTARSRHPGGVNLVMADGSVSFIANDVTLPVWQAMASCNAAD
jgi:prepilin-type processing-associated H-X9-DG protein